MLLISNNISIPDNEITLTAIRAQGSGGQNVNKVSSAVHLFFNIHNSTLSEFYKKRLLNKRDHRITKDGIIIIKAQCYRTQEQNREDALLRLAELIRNVGKIQKKRKITKPSKSSQTKRLDKKTRRSTIKQNRKKVEL